MEMLGLPRLLWSGCIGSEVVNGKTKAVLASFSTWLSQAFSFNQLGSREDVPFLFDYFSPPFVLRPV